MNLMGKVELTDVDISQFIVDQLIKSGYRIKNVGKGFYILKPTDNIWRYSKSGVLVQQLILTFAQNYVSKFRAWCQIQMSLTPDKAKIFKALAAGWVSWVKFNKKIEQIVKTIGSLPEIHDATFSEFLDDKSISNWNYLAFNNCKFDLLTHTFSQIKPDDYITLTTGYDWPEHPIDTREMEAMLAQIQPERAVRDFLLRLLSTGLEGKTLQKIVIFYGAGANSKSTLNEIMHNTLGDYAYTLPASCCLGRSRGSGVNVEVTKMNLRRYCVCSECESVTESLNTSFLKSVTGGSQINSRTLYSDKTKTRVCPTLILETNNKPRLPATDAGCVDNGIVRRMIEIDFPSRFVENPDDRPNYFRADPTIQTKANQGHYNLQMMSLLIGAHMEKSKIGLAIPPRILKNNQEYISENDELYIAFSELFNKIATKNLIPLKDVWKDLRGSFWFSKMSNRQQRRFNYKNFPNQLENHHYFSKYLVKRLDGFYLKRHTAAPRFTGFS